MILLILRIISTFLNRLPQKWVVGLGDLVGWGWYFLIPIRKKTVLENLQQAFSDRSTEEIVQIARANYRHYGQMLMEVLRSMTWSPDECRRQLVVEGIEYVRPFEARGKGGFFLTCHMGNWELSALVGLVTGIPVDVVVKRAKSRTVERLLYWYRKRFQVGILWETGTAKDMLRSLSKGRFIVFLLDQFMGPPIGLPVKFFGRQAGTAAAIALLTDKRDVPVFPSFSYRDSNGRLHAVVQAPIKYPSLSKDKAERLHQKTQIYNDVIEAMIRKHPEQWLWVHRRWKPYRGTPRWAPQRSLTSSLTALVLSLLLSACASKGPNHTGIILPPEPEVTVPDFSEINTVKVSELGAKGTTTTADDPTKREIKSRKGKKKTKKKADMNTNQVPVRVFAVEDLPFEVGEVQKIKIRWMMLPAGTAELEVDPGVTIKGRKTFLLHGRILSSRIVDTIYHVDNRVESHVDQQALVPYKFLLSMSETHQKKETRVKFDHVKNVAHYQADRVSKKWGDQKEDRKDELSPFSQDMFSALYYVRTLDYAMGRTERFFVYENGKNLEVGLTPVGEELVVSQVGAFQCWKIKVTLRLNNVLRSMGDVFLWLSQDSKKYIVKFDAKIKIGSLNGALIAIRER